MKLKKKKFILRLLALLFIFFNAISFNAQTPGLIVEGTDPNNVLDPNNDGYVSLPPSQTPSQFTSVGYPANILPTDVNDILYNEIPFIPIPQVIPEPVADVTKGPSCGFTDMVEDADSKSTYYYTDGTTNMVFRFRLGDAKPNSKGYSVLIDTDEKFGFSGPNADPNAVVGNPGFEVEIVLRTNFTVDAYDIDGSADPNSTIASRPYTTHAIKSLALTTVCDDPDYFYDFYLPFSDLTGYITPSTKIRMVTITSIAPKEATGENTTSDISGVDDSTGSKDDLFDDVIDNQTPTDATEDPIVRADCPQITGPINDGTGITVNGTTTLESGNTTTIEVFVDGASQGTTTTTGTSWSYTIAGAITPGQKITATATVRDSSGTLVKGTSEDNCDTETVADSSCTPPATPVITGVGGSGGKIIQGTSGFTSGTAIIVRIFNNESELTTWGSVNAGPNGFTTTAGTGGAWSFNGGGGFKANSGYYTVIVMLASNTTCQSVASTPFSYCGGNDGSVTSGAITFDTPTSLIVNTSTISGTAQTNSTIRLYRNNVYTGLSDPSDGNTAWSIDISSLTLEVGDVLYVSNLQATAVCTSVSANRTVVEQSIAPVVTIDGCFDGNATSISGTSSEIGATIRLYTRIGAGVTTSDSQVGTTPTVDANGNWTVTGLNIPSGNYVAATAQNTGETLSDISNEVLISSKTTGITLSITSDPITEGDASIIGASTGLPAGSTITLYIDGDKAVNSSGNDVTDTTDVSGNWTFSGLDTPLEILFADAVITVTATSNVAGSCESDQSSSKVVICNPPTVPTITANSSSPICEGGNFIVTIASTETGLGYQLLDQNDNTVGPTIIGTGAAVNVETDPIAFGVTSLKVKAFKLLSTCTTVESNSVGVVVNPSPTITFGPNPSVTQNVSAQTVNLTFSATTNSPNQYSIDFDTTANTAGFVDVALTTLPVSPIVINVPANVAAGVYNAFVTVKEPVNGCEKSYPITITILDSNAPMVTFGNSSVSQCAGVTTADFSYSLDSGDTPTLYTVDFNDVANLQGFTDFNDVALPTSPITITVPTNPNAGTYNGIIRFKTAGGLVSQEYPITISIQVTDPGTVGQNQIISSGDDVAAFTSIQDASGLGGIDYQWYKSTTNAPGSFSVIVGAISATYDEGTITETTYYKRIATSGTNGCVAESNVITVKVLALTSIPMITQVYQDDSDVFIEVTNIGTVDITAGQINLQLYRDKNRVLSGQIPDATFTYGSTLPVGKSLLIGTTSAFSNVTNIDNAHTSTNALITNLEGGNDIITLSTVSDGTSWDNRYDVVSSIPNKTSFVRIDETLVPNTDYTPAEWVVFVDNDLDPYRLLAAGGAERHPHAPLISEIKNPNTEANIKLGLHRINITTRTGSAWNNGYPDRSRFVVIDEDYNHTLTRFSARKLTVNASRKLGITDSLLVVTNDVVLNGDIRLINSSGATGNSESQFIQTHTSASLVSGGGRLLVDQNSTVPSKYRYNYVGSPVTSSAGASDYTVASILKDGTNPTTYTGTIGNLSSNIARDITFLAGSTLDGDATTTPISLADRWMYTYAASGGTRASWDQKRSTGPIPNTDGFIFKGPGVVQNYTFMGVPKDGVLTTTIGADESYLVANPYASSISVKEFIEDNTNSITGTLYFWEHAGEDNTETGHNFAGYIGGYATRTIATGVTAKAASSGPIDTNLQAESATITGGTTETVSGNDGNVDVVTLDAANESIEFKGITSGVDTLSINYKAASAKIIRIKVNNVSKGDFTFPATEGIFNFVKPIICVETGSNITFESIDANSIQIDYLNLKDDGKTSCAPNVGGDEVTYTEPEPYIAIGQGFFVSGDSDGGTITFNNSQREYKTEGTGSSVFLRSSKSSNTSSNSILNLPVVKLGMDFKDTNDGNDYHRQIAVSFSEYTSFDYDKGYDAEIYDIGATDFYWKFPSNEDKYVIAGVNAISNDLEVPLEITMGYSGAITIKVDEMKNINQPLYITDKVNNVSYEIINGTATLTLDQGVYSERFVLAFEASGALSVDDNILNSYTNIYTDNKNKLLVITKNQEIDINKVTMYSILGRKVSHWTIKEQEDRKQLKIQRELPTGVYIVKLNTNKGEISKKVVIE